MLDITIKVEIGLGSDITTAIDDAIILAKKTDCTINFLFNDTEISVDGDSVIDEVLDNFRKRGDK